MIHHEFGPSSWPAIKKCAYFLPVNSEKDFDSIGTKMHSLCEALTLNHTIVDFMGLSQDQIDSCFRAVRSMFKYVEQKFGKILNIETEQRVTIYKSNGEVFSFGHQDLHLYCEKGEVGLDWKSCFDYDLYKVDYSPQQKGYGLARMQKNGNSSINWLEWYILPNKFKSYTITAVDASTAIQAIYNKRENKDNYERNISYFCRFCANFGKCPKILEISSPALKVPSIPLDVPFDELDGDIIGHYVRVSKNILNPMIEKIKGINDRIKKRAIELIDRGRLFDIKKKESKKKSVSDIIQLYERVKHLVTIDEFQSLLKISLNDLYKVVYQKNKHQKGYTKKSAENEVFFLIEDLINYSISISLVEDK